MLNSNRIQTAAAGLQDVVCLLFFLLKKREKKVWREVPVPVRFASSKAAQAGHLGWRAQMGPPSGSIRRLTWPTGRSTQAPAFSWFGPCQVFLFPCGPVFILWVIDLKDNWFLSSHFLDFPFLLFIYNFHHGPLVAFSWRNDGMSWLCMTCLHIPENCKQNCSCRFCISSLFQWDTM